MPATIGIGGAQRRGRRDSKLYIGKSPGRILGLLGPTGRYILELLGPAGGAFWNSWGPRGRILGAGLDPPKQKALPHPDRTRVVLRLLLFRNIASDCVLHILSVERSAAETTILETPVLAHMQLSHNMTLCARASYEASLKSQYLQKTHYLQKTQYHTGSCRCWVDGVSPPQA